MSRTSGKSKWSRVLLGALSMFLIAASMIAVPATAADGDPTIESDKLD
jgi:hypothetical protein